MESKMHRIARLRPGAEPLTLVLDWDDGTRTPVDLTGLIARSRHIGALADQALFAQAETIEDGHGVEWPGGLDLSAGTLRLLAEEQQPMTGAQFAEWQTLVGISTGETADLLDCSVSTIKKMRAAVSKPVPLPVQVTCRAMWREPVVLSAHYRPRRPGRPRKRA